jgi:hypothetical protein
MRTVEYIFWAGFDAGKLSFEPEPRPARDGYCALYRTRREARKYHQDARRVILRVNEGVKP